MHVCALVLVETSPCVFLRLSSCGLLWFVNCVPSVSPVALSFFLVQCLSSLTFCWSCVLRPPPEQRTYRDRYQRRNPSHKQPNRKPLSFFFLDKQRSTTSGWSRCIFTFFFCALSWNSDSRVRSWMSVNVPCVVTRLCIMRRPQSHQYVSVGVWVCCCLCARIYVCSNARDVFWWKCCMKTRWQTSLPFHDPLFPPFGVA